MSRYPEYKDSGVAWLGQVPAQWTVAPFKRLVEFQNGADHKAVEVDDGYPVFGSGGVFAYASEYLYDGESVLLGRKGTIDKPLYVIGKFWTVDTMYWTRIKPDACGKFCYYAATSFPFAYYSTNTALPSMTQSALGAHLIAYPAKAEQHAIAAFLDRETAKIDALVAEQEKLIALLKEERQAVISHAVTKGLDPNVPMKDSGIEWLGQVPAHWGVLTVRRISESVQTGGTPSVVLPGEELEDGFVWFTPGDFGASLRLVDSARKTTVEAIASGDAKQFPAGSVLIVSIGATLGKVGFAAFPASANQQVNAVMPSVEVDGYFLAYSLSVKEEVMRFLSNASTIGIMNQEKTKDIWLAVPPRNEQSAITEFLDCETTKLDALTAEALLAIELLKERRSALISAAVTGKIDVREVNHHTQSIAA